MVDTIRPGSYMFYVSKARCYNQSDRHLSASDLGNRIWFNEISI